MPEEYQDPDDGGAGDLDEPGNGTDAERPSEAGNGGNGSNGDDRARWRTAARRWPPSSTASSGSAAPC